jgi:hypothetical protein
MASGGLFPRMLRASKLEPQLYEEVEADKVGTGQALLVVVLVSLSTGIGYAIADLMKGERGSIVGFVPALAWGVILLLAVWFIFSLLCFWLGTSIFKGPETKSSLSELLRTMGFAYSPSVLNIFSFIPFIGHFIPFATFIWAMIAAIIAVRQACDFTTGRAAGTVIIAAIIPLIIMVLLALLAEGTFTTLIK